MSDSELARVLKDVDPEAVDKFIADRRAEISDRVKQQHQITVAAGATVAVAAGFLGNVDPPAGVLLALCLLLFAFTFAFLNQDLLIISAARFIVESGTAHGQVQQAWEAYLKKRNRNLERPRTRAKLNSPRTWFPRARTSLRASSNYAVPVVGAVAAGIAFGIDLGFSWWLLLLAVPLAFSVLLAGEIAEVVASYQSTDD